jgi:hypothetical protein
MTTTHTSCSDHQYRCQTRQARDILLDSAANCFVRDDQRLEPNRRAHTSHISTRRPQTPALAGEPCREALGKTALRHLNCRVLLSVASISQNSNCQSFLLHTSNNTLITGHCTNTPKVSLLSASSQSSFSRSRSPPCTTSKKDPCRHRLDFCFSRTRRTMCRPTRPISVAHA